MGYNWNNGRLAEIKAMPFVERVFELLRLERKRDTVGLTGFEREKIVYIRNIEDAKVKEMMREGLSIFECRHLNHFFTTMIKRGRPKRVCLGNMVLRLLDEMEEADLLIYPRYIGRRYLRKKPKKKRTIPGAL